MLEAVPPSATWRRAMPWWQGEISDLRGKIWLLWRNRKWTSILPALDVAYRQCRILTGKQIKHTWPAHGIFMIGRCTSCLRFNTAHLISIHVNYFTKLTAPQIRNRRCQWPRGVRRGLQVRIAPRARMPMSCKCSVLSGKDLCDELIPRPEESYHVCVCVCVCVSLNVMRCNNKLSEPTMFT